MEKLGVGFSICGTPLLRSDQLGVKSIVRRLVRLPLLGEYGVGSFHRYMHLLSRLNKD